MDKYVSITLVLALVLAAIAFTIVLVALKNKKKKQLGEPDYRAFFILGITFFPVGISLAAALDNPGFIGMSAMGFIFLVIALANRDKWQKSEQL